MPDFTLTIGGQNVAGAARPIPIVDPSTGQAFTGLMKAPAGTTMLSPLTTLLVDLVHQAFTESPAATVAQLDQAVDAAALAFATWQHSTHAERSAALERVAVAIEQNAAELADLVVREQGKPLALAQMEVGGAVAWTRAAAALEIPVEVIEAREGKRIELHRKPLGVVGSITPWNWPINQIACKVVPARRCPRCVWCKSWPPCCPPGWSTAWWARPRWARPWPSTRALPSWCSPAPHARGKTSCAARRATSSA